MNTHKFVIKIVLMILAFGTIFPGHAQTITATHTEGLSTSEVVFTIPIGDDGILYEDVGISDSLVWGPSALAVSTDNTFWIADTVGNRLRHYSVTGKLLATISLDGAAIGVGDLGVTDNGFWVLDVASVPPKVVRLTSSGSVSRTIELPVGLRLEDGLTGIALGEKGEVLIERRGGEALTQLTDSQGSLVSRELPGYTFRGHTITASFEAEASFRPARGFVSIGDRRVEVTVTHRLGGLRILGYDSTTGLYVIVDELAANPVLHVDQTIRRYSDTGEFLGLTRVPLAERYTYVSHGLAIGPGGTAYMLVTKPDRAEVQRLHFVSALEPILPATGEIGSITTEGLGRLGREYETQSCYSRDTIMSNAYAYTSNSAYLNNTNINGSCSGRGKPRYLGSAGYYSSVSYDWGGFDTVGGFNLYMSSNYQAGDIDAAGSESCSRGVDCSGFVSRAWGLSQKYGTWTIDQVSYQIAASSVETGDILNKAGDHMVLVSQQWTGGVDIYESTTYNNWDRVVFNFSGWDRFNGYVGRVYNNACPLP